jgi:hypothetical protein
MEFDMNSEEGQLMFALQESAKEATKQAKNVLDNEISQRSRFSMNREDKHMIAHVTDGIICQFNTLNQFGDQFDAIKEEFVTASAICGWLTVANVILLQKFLMERKEISLHLDDVRSFITNTLSNMDMVLPELRKCMSYTQNKRNDFWKANGKERAERLDLMQWVANYEVSELLKTYCRHDASQNPYCLPPIFMRYNQWPERDAATKDEFEQLQSESRFGGVRNPEDGSMTYQEGDSVYFIEEYSEASSSFRFTPEEWHEKFSLSISPPPPDQEDSSRRTSDETAIVQLPRSMAINLNGHFVAGLACVIDGINYLYIINTTEGSYVDFDPIVVWSFDTAFSQ